MVDNAFEPEHIIVASGTPITWMWDDGLAEEHNVVGDAFETRPAIRGECTHEFDR